MVAIKILQFNHHLKTISQPTLVGSQVRAKRLKGPAPLAF
jgi:hypothetical protein